MHLADGVINVPTIAATYAGTAALVGYGIGKIKEEEIPKISLMTGTFFAVSLISIPVGPSSIHPLIAGLIGVMLGKRAPVAIFIGLLFQALLFQHGGLTTLGANTLMLAIPALLSHTLYQRIKGDNAMKKGMIVGATATIMSVILLVAVLVTSQPLFAQGAASVVNLIIIGHIPLVVIEAFVTGSALQLIMKSRPNWITGGGH